MDQSAINLPRGRPKRRFQSLRTITALILREMSSTYGRSPGGYLWAILEPLGMIVVLSTAFSMMLRTPSLGTSFVLFYATGLMPFRVYTEIHAVTSGAIRYSRALLVYPAVSYIDALLARLILAFLTQIMISYVILTGALAVSDVRLVIDFRPILISFSVAALLGFGVGTVNCLLFDFFPIWKSLWTTATRPLFLFSAIIYIYEDMPLLAKQILWYNPLIHLTGLSREGFYSYYEPSYISMPYVISIALIAMLIGLMQLRRNYRKLMVI